MKKVIISICLFYSIGTYSQSWPLVNFAGGNVCPDLDHVLVFEDDFNGNSLDETKWYTYFPYGPDNSDQCSFCRTHSTDDHQEGQIYLDKNVRVENGICYLDVIKENASWYQFNKKYTSGMLYSKQQFNTYSKYEIRCKAPTGTGYFPAFWAFGWNTEIDVFEFFEQNDRYVVSVHFWDNGYDTWNQWVQANQNLSLDFHTYSVVYDPFYIHFYLDDVIVATMPRYYFLSGDPVSQCLVQPGVYLQHPEYPQYGNPLNVIANVALFNGPAEAEQVTEKSMEIDFIRVYQRIDLCPDKEDLVFVKNNETWSANRTIKSLVVNHGKSLLLNDLEIEFAENGILLLGNNSTLILDNSTLTTCSGVDIWKGIKAGVNSTIIVRNNSTIENAEIGVDLEISPNLPLTFNNNPRLTMNNLSGIKNCNIGVRLGSGKTESKIFGGSWIHD
jgi:beta-glucanase (GH16 family)